MYDSKASWNVKACPYRKLHPTILMMKSAEKRPRDKLAAPLDGPMTRRILTHGQMSSELVGVGRKDSAEMVLAKDDDVIEALSPDGTDQSLRMPVLPG